MKTWKYLISIQGFGSSKSYKDKNNTKQYGYLKFVSIFNHQKNQSKKNHQITKTVSC